MRQVNLNSQHYTSSLWGLQCIAYKDRPSDWPANQWRLTVLSLMSSLLLGDLNDYIQPTVACVRPVEASTPEKPVEINLNDCLACSGCITSAEAVLVAEQTHHQLYSFREQNMTVPPEGRRILVLSICPSSRTALCRKFRMGPQAVYRRLVTFFTKFFGAYAVMETTLGACLSLYYSALDFAKHFRAGDRSMMPRLCSECPGWICYAEKKQPGLLSKIAPIRSPQQVIGSLIKGPFFSEYFQGQRSTKLGRGDIFHTAIMSCYDKKLEASRDDFRDEQGIRDVDCVITTNELLQMFQESLPDGDFASLEESPPSRDNPFYTLNEQLDQLSFRGGCGGGYLFHIMRHAAREFFSIDLPIDITLDPRVRVNHIRGNLDYTEYSLESPESPEGRPLLRFAALSGFRNIQTFVQKCKTNKIDYDYVEIMACPGACLFGGGQPLPDLPERVEFRRQMEELHLAQSFPLDRSLPIVEEILRWIDGDPQHRQATIEAYFKSVESLQKKKSLINVQW